jgi:hypothetical protein
MFQVPICLPTDIVYRLSIALKFELKDFFEYYHLQREKDLKFCINLMSAKFSNEEISLIYKFISLTEK